MAVIGRQRIRRKGQCRVHQGFGRDDPVDQAPGQRLVRPDPLARQQDHPCPGRPDQGGQTRPGPRAAADSQAASPGRRTARSARQSADRRPAPRPSHPRPACRSARQWSGPGRRQWHRRPPPTPGERPRPAFISVQVRPGREYLAFAGQDQHLDPRFRRLCHCRGHGTQHVFGQRIRLVAVGPAGPCSTLPRVRS